MLLLDQPEPPTAIFVANDVMAAGAIDAARERGLSPPADLALVGFDAREMSRYLRPALTTVTRPTYDLGRTAASLLVEQVMKLRSGAATVAVRGRLVYRCVVRRTQHRSGAGRRGRSVPLPAVAASAWTGLGSGAAGRRRRSAPNPAASDRSVMNG